MFGYEHRDKSNPGRSAALKAYKALVPSYALGTKLVQGALFHSFVIGRVLFVVMDTSSERVMENRTTLGEEQLTWFVDKLHLLVKRPNEFLSMVWVR